MIRVIQRRLIIPRGDTGIFTIPAMTQAEGAIGVFTIFDPITNTRIFQKQVEIEGENFNISFSHADTVNLKAGDYLWDIKFYKNPILADNKVIDGEEINSYYAAFQAPKCEIRETGDDFLMIEGQPAKIEDLNIILGATEAANAAKIAATEQAGIAAAKAEEAAAKLEEMMAAMPTKVSELENDSGYLQEETDPTVPAWAKAQTKPSYTPQEVGALPADTFIPSKVSDLTDDSGHYTKPASGIPASDLEETYLTEHQDLSNYVQKTDYASMDNAGIVKILSGSHGLNVTNTGIIRLQPAASQMIKEPDAYPAAKFNPIAPKTQHEAVFYGLAKAAGSDEKNSELPVGQYSNTAKAAIQQMLDVPSTADIPTKVSQLQNDSGYLTSFTETDPTVPEWAKAAQKPSYTAAEVGAPTVQEMNSAIGTAIGSVNSFDMAVVQELPTQDISTHTIYLVPKTGETNDVYDEYVYINNAWEMVGNTQIDLSNYVQKTDYATTNNAGVVRLGTGCGLSMEAGLILSVQGANNSEVKTGTHPSKPIVPSKQHSSVFYGLAKAAGSDEKNSELPVGQYTDAAKTAIQTMLDVPSNADLALKADKTDTVLETTLSRGRKDNTTVGGASLAFGVDTEASGYYSVALGLDTTASSQGAFAEGKNTVAHYIAHAEGEDSQALSSWSHAQNLGTIANGGASSASGRHTIANGADSFVFGKYNAEDSYDNWPTWAANTSYEVGDRVKRNLMVQNEPTDVGYHCTVANSDATFDVAHWELDGYHMNYVEIVGNGKEYEDPETHQSVRAGSNAYALEWNGTGHFAGDVYVNANADSTGGIKLIKATDYVTSSNAGLMSVEDKEIVDNLKFIVTNQAKFDDTKQYEVTGGTYEIIDGKIIFTCDGTTNKAGIKYYDNFDADINDKIYISVKRLVNTTVSSINLGYNEQTLSNSLTNVNNVNVVKQSEQICTIISSNELNYINYYVRKNSLENVSFTLEEPIYINLTKTFGAGNEPNINLIKEIISSNQWPNQSINILNKEHLIKIYDTASKSNPEFYGSLSMGRKSNTTIGSYSSALGMNTEASGIYSFAEGGYTVAANSYSHAEGFNTIAKGSSQHTSGKFNIADTYDNWPEWVANTEYAVGDKVKTVSVVNGETLITACICVTANNDAVFTPSKWRNDYNMNYVSIIGNGTADNARSNAYALDWSGNGHYMGNIYVGANADSTGGTRVATITELAAKLDAAEAGLKVVRLI